MSEILGPGTPDHVEVDSTGIIEKTNDKYFAIVGTRKPDRVQAELAYLLAWAITGLGNHVVRTGAAYGVDQKAMEGTHGKHLEVCLPWRGYNQDIIPVSASVVVYNPDVHHAWTDSVSRYHPDISSLGRVARALHARTFGVIHGCTGVIALTGEDGGGGTEQAVRIAAALRIPVIQGNKGSITDMPRWMGAALQSLGLASKNLAPTYRPSEFQPKE